jgi:hypothetical protein
MAGFLRIANAMCLAVTMLSISAQGQQKSRTPSPAARCHARIMALYGARVKFGEKSRQELYEIARFLNACVEESFESLSKADLSKAAMELEWVTYSVDQLPDQASAVVPKDAAMVKVSPFEVGSIFYMTFAGLRHTCQVQTTDEVSCKYYPGSTQYDPVTQKTSLDIAYRYFTGGILTYNGQRQVIGCVYGDHTCLRPVYGDTPAVIEGTTVRFPSWKVQWSDPATGRKLDEQPALFTLLSAVVFSAP